MTLREAVGQCFIVGVGEASLSQVETAWLRLLQPAGIVLFARNIQSAVQTRALLDDAQGQVRQQLFKCVDLEGGSVDRLRNALAPIPSVAEIAAHRSTKLNREHGELIGRAAALFGFNVTFAPVLDLTLPESFAVMGTRTAGATPQQVAAYAGPMLDGLRAAGVLGCGKHFPGLGGGTLDSHHFLPRIERTREQMFAEDILPYRKLRKELPMVMVSHAAYPHITAPDEPASLSHWWMMRTLRSTVAYKGLVLSDDLEMQAVLERGIEEAALQTLGAGADIALICHRAELILAAYEAVLHEAEKSVAFRKQINGAARRVTRARRLLPHKAVPYSPRAEEHLRERIQRFRTKVATP